MIDEKTRVQQRWTKNADRVIESVLAVQLIGEDAKKGERRSNQNSGILRQIARPRRCTPLGDKAKLYK